MEEKLQKLLAELSRMETEDVEIIRQKRIAADMGDDFRENEAAKLIADDQRLWYARKLELKREILELKKKIIAARR